MALAIVADSSFDVTRLAGMGRAPKVALRPEAMRGFLSAAIEAGGGEVVEPADADALIWADPADADGLADVLRQHPSIRWVQLPWAGIEPMLDVLDHDRTWTCGKGVYAEEVAEHALALALAGFRRVAHYARSTAWSAPEGRSLLGAKVTILGAGGIAQSLTRMLGPFGCEVTVVRRQSEPFEGAHRTATQEELPGILATTDLLVLALALTPETTGIIGAAALELLADDAWIVNVARGRHIDTDALADALSERRIGGAALDVTDPEPLPADHPLWQLDNCIITPHTANTPEMAMPVLSRRVTENVRRFGAGEPLLGLVDVDAAY